MYSELFRRMLAIGEEILWRTNYADLRKNSHQRYLCQKGLSTFCGVWNEFRRGADKERVPIKNRRQTLREYAEIGRYIRRLEDYDFQNPDKKELQKVRKTIKELLDKISASQTAGGKRNAERTRERPVSSDI
jgi:hypothetical protein